jgi:DNA-binding transcriptional LysR family regulator
VRPQAREVVELLHDEHLAVAAGTTLVARRLGLSQSAVSHALARSRVLFGDPLFVRKPYGLEPTRHALDLAPRIEALIATIHEALGLSDSFEPATSTRDFRIGAPDHLATLMAPPLLRAFAAHAPHARFAFSQRLGQDAIEALARDELDLAIGRFALPVDTVAIERLFDDRYCLVARRRHPRIRGKHTRGLYAPSSITCRSRSLATFALWRSSRSARKA